MVVQYGCLMRKGDIQRCAMVVQYGCLMGNNAVDKRICKRTWNNV